LGVGLTAGVRYMVVVFDDKELKEKVKKLI